MRRRIRDYKLCPMCIIFILHFDIWYFTFGLMKTPMHTYSATYSAPIVIRISFVGLYLSKT